MPWPYFAAWSHAPRRNSRSQQRGIILVIVLVVIVLLALAAYTFSDLMMTHRRAAK